MQKGQATQFVQGTLYEENYLVRSLGTLAYSPEVALTELVANAWDAGATGVNIFIPEDHGQKMVIEDNGIGLTKDQFYNRWMRLGYSRIKHQGKKVAFPPGINATRLAYGRNGVGRHGLLCFNTEYTVITESGGKQSTFVVTTSNDEQPFVIKSEKFGNSRKYGTRLEVIVSKHLPKPDHILRIISAKFLHDPNFVVSINKKTVPLEELSGLINSKEVSVGKIKLQLHFVDTQKTARSTLYQGIAFWQGGRLVGEPSWILGFNAILDGRTKFAKRYTVVVKTDDLEEYVLEDWTGFKMMDAMKPVYDVVERYVQEVFSEIAKENIEETKEQIRNEFAHDYSNLSPLAKFEVNEAIEAIAVSHPTVKPESISIAVEAIINLEKTRSGKELLIKLSQLKEDDISGLNRLLDNWTVRDALSVLDEIDTRISVIEAIRKLSRDKDVDELHVLHPLVSAARWLFGPEFESAEFASNRQLQTAAELVFKTKIQKNAFKNHRKRPDIVVVGNSCFSITGTESFTGNSSLAIVNKILVIELKRGGFKLTRKERDQASGYVEDFINCGVFTGSPHVEAFVIGQEFSEKIQTVNALRERGKVHICTFAQLVDTAEKRLFGLRERLTEKYDDIPGIDLFTKASTQLNVGF